MDKSRKTKYIGFRAEESLVNFLDYVIKNISPKDVMCPSNRSDLITSILKRFWLEFMLGKATPPVSELEKQFREMFNHSKSHGVKKAKKK
jgi:hypothetical protein